MAAFLGVVMSLAGCAPPPPVDSGYLTTRPWTFDGVAGTEIRSAHYRLLTTVTDARVVGRFLTVMEAAYADYQALVPPDPARGGLLEIELFATPDQWETQTRRLTGRDAELYLSVGQGGYAYGDRFVCWLAAENDLWGVAAHEGFHQYVARHLRSRLPPAVEEGLATTFENVSVGDGHATIDTTTNPRRQAGVVDGRRLGLLVNLDTLVRMHAGDIAGRPLAVREAFYGQCWELARLWTTTPAYLDGLRRLLADLEAGTVAHPVGTTLNGGLYLPAACGPLLMAYLGTSWDAFEAAYSRRLETVTVDTPDR